MPYCRLDSGQFPLIIGVFLNLKTISEHYFTLRPESYDCQNGSEESIPLRSEMELVCSVVQAVICLQDLIRLVIDVA